MFPKLLSLLLSPFIRENILVPDPDHIDDLAHDPIIIEEDLPLGLDIVVDTVVVVINCNYCFVKIRLFSIPFIFSCFCLFTIFMFFIVLIFCIFILSVNSLVILSPEEDVVLHTISSFGYYYNNNSIVGNLVQSIPFDACQPLQLNATGRIVLAIRGGFPTCTFTTKVKNVYILNLDDLD